MKLYLMQHGKALSKEEDPERPLSEEGRSETGAAAGFMAGHSVVVDRIWHSTRRRSRQTAEMVARALGGLPLEEQTGLGPTDPVAEAAVSVAESGVKNLLIAGHMPFVQTLSALLLTGGMDTPVVRFTNSGILCLEKNDTWQVAWYAVPGMM